MASVRKFLTADLVKRLYLTFVANALPTQEALLESAVNSPMNIKHYNQQDDVFVLAAELAVKLIKNHAYMDGNKRLALVAANKFLEINGYQLQVTTVNHNDVVNAHTAIANGVWTAEQLAAFYRSIATSGHLPAGSEALYYSENACVY
jgi:death-on-curing family protein